VLRLTAFIVASTTLLLVSADAVAQTAATPFALPATPDPVECGIEPRSEDEIAALLATPVTATPAAESEVDRIPADHATTAFAVSIVREALACGNAHGLPGVAALLSDTALARDVLGSESPADALTFSDRASAPTQAEHRALVEVRDAVLLSDGRVAAVAVIKDPEHGLVERVFAVTLAEGVAGAGGSDQYLFIIDGVRALDSATPDPGAGTPAQ
jgi:hypothetical protein